MSAPSPAPATLLAAALGISDAAARRTYLDRVCAGDATARSELVLSKKEIADGKRRAQPWLA